MSDLWFGTEKKGFNQLGDFIHIEADWNTANSTFEFSAARLLKLDDGSIVVGMQATNITGVAGNVKVEYPFACAVTIHTGEYEIYDAKSKGKVKVQQSNLEKVFLKAFAEAAVDFDKVYTGRIAFALNPVFAGDFLDGSVPMSVFMKNAWAVTDADEAAINSIKDLRLESSKNGSKGGGYAKGQSELEKLNDRVKFIQLQFPSVFTTDSPMGEQFTALPATSQTAVADFMAVILGSGRKSETF